MPDFNGTITAGGTAQTIFDGRPQRYYIRNESTGNLRITDDGGTASSTVGILLKPDEAIWEDKPTIGPLTIWGATTGQAYSGKVD